MAIASGNKAALSELYDAIAPRLFGLIVTIIPETEHAEEILKQVFLEVWQKADMLNTQSINISEWLWQRCKVLCMVAYRRNFDRYEKSTFKQNVASVKSQKIQRRNQ